MISPISIYVKSERERQRYVDLLSALAEARDKGSMSEAALMAIDELAECEAGLPGGGKIAAILAKYDKDGE